MKARKGNQKSEAGTGNTERPCPKTNKTRLRFCHVPNRSSFSDYVKILKLSPVQCQPFQHKAVPSVIDALTLLTLDHSSVSIASIRLTASGRCLVDLQLSCNTLS